MTLRVITLTGEVDREAEIAQEFAQRRDVDLLLRCVDRADYLAFVRAASLDAVVAVGVPPWFDNRAATEAQRQGIRLVALGVDSYDAERLSVLFNTVLDWNAKADEIVQACRNRLIEDAPLPPFIPPRGALVAVWGPKGAPGRTRTAVELAMAMSARDRSCLLIDADTYGGDVVQLLGIIEDLPTLTWATQQASKLLLDGSSLREELRRVGHGPVVLPGIARPDLWQDIGREAWEQLIDVARDGFSWSIVDTGFCLEETPSLGFGAEWAQGRNDVARSTVAHADTVACVCRGDPAGIKQFLWAFEQVRALSDRPTVIVATRVERRARRSVQALLERETGAACYCVPDVSRFLNAAAYSGRTLWESSDNVMRALISRITDAVVEAARVPDVQTLAVAT